MKQFSLEEYLAHPEKKLVTREGAIVRLLCTDRNSKHGQIVGLVGTDEKIKLWSKDGQYDGYDNAYDLFFADEEEELTEFEKGIKDMGHSVMFMTTECIKQKAKELLELAKKELSEKGEIITLGDLTTYDIGFQDGKADTLKYLPKWKKTKPERGKSFGAGPWYGSGIMHDNGKHVVFFRGYEISVDELFDKLPKED